MNFPLLSVDPNHPLLFWDGWPSSYNCNAPILGKHPWTRGLAPYKTPEHLFQAFKAESLEDHELVRRTRLPSQAKARGRSINLRIDWNETGESGMPVCYETMLYAHRLKYRIPTYRELLLASNDRPIAEVSPRGDTRWGLVTEQGIPSGENLLGIVLMQIRLELRGQQVTHSIVEDLEEIVNRLRPLLLPAS